MTEKQINPDSLQINREKKLGKSGEGEVYPAILVGEGGDTTEVAVKLTNKNILPAVLHGAENKIYADYLSKSPSPHFLEYFGGDDKMLVLELCEQPALNKEEFHNKLDALSSQDRLTALLSILKGSAEALQELHDRKLVHNDVHESQFLAPENLWDSSNVKLIDFTVATKADEELEGAAESIGRGRSAYSSYEKFVGYHSIQSDLFALGIVFYKLLLHVPNLSPWPFKKEKNPLETTSYPSFPNTEEAHSIFSGPPKFRDIEEEYLPQWLINVLKQKNQDQQQFLFKLNSFFSRVFAEQPSGRPVSADQLFMDFVEVFAQLIEN